MHVAHQCGSGISYELGKDTVCIECGNEATVSGCELDRDGQLALNEYGEPYGCEWWVRTPCKSEVMDPIDFQPCGTCTGPYYERETCGITRNTICEACADSTNADGERRAISHCAFSDHLCDQGERMPGEMNGYASSEVRCGYYPGEVSDDNDARRAARFKALGINPVTAADMCGEGGVECTLDACEPGYLGPRCDYLRIFTGCGTHMKDMSEIRANGSRRTTDENGEEIDDEVQALAGHFIERTAKMGRNWYNDDGHVPGQSYKTSKEAIVNFSTALQGTGPDTRNMRSFMVWCMDLCDEYPECTAFELDDGGDSYVSSGPLDPMAGGPAGDEANGLPAGVQADSVCRLYNGPSQPDDMVDRDCYINIRRQSEADVIANLKRRAEADGTLVDPLTGAPVLTSLLDFLDFGKDDNGTPDDANDDCELACGGDGSDCASMVWCPSKQACINTTNEPCPTCTGEETTAVCSDGFSATQQACEMAHCSFNDSIEGTAGITTREGCLALCGAGEHEEIVNQTAGRENPNVQISRVYSTEMERCKDVEGRRVCPLVSINRCVWYDAKDNAGAVLAATWTEATCDPSGCGPDFQWCYLEDTCMRSELLETSDSNEGQIKSPLGCNNGFRLSNNVGYDDTMWYAAGSGSELLFGAYTGGSLDIVNEPFFK
jgi:hypothetical protein